MSAEKTGKRTVKVRLYKNNTSTAAEAPYLGRAVDCDAVSNDDIIAAMAKSHPAIDATTARLVMDALGGVIGECLGKGQSVRLPFALLEPHITGSFETEDAPVTPGRNELTVRITPSPSLRAEVAKLEVEIVGAPQSDLALNGVETPSLGRAGVDVVTSGEALTVTGRGFCDGTLKASIADAAGAEHALALTAVRPLYAQGTAPAGLATGEARLTLVLTDARGCDFTVSRKITVA